MRAVGGGFEPVGECRESHLLLPEPTKVNRDERCKTGADGSCPPVFHGRCPIASLAFFNPGLPFYFFTSGSITERCTHLSPLVVTGIAAVWTGRNGRRYLVRRFWNDARSAAQSCA